MHVKDAWGLLKAQAKCHNWLCRAVSRILQGGRFLNKKCNIWEDVIMKQKNSAILLIYLIRAFY